MAQISRSPDAEMTLGLWALPRGASAVRVTHSPFPGAECTFDPARYRIAVAAESGVRPIDLGTVRFAYRFVFGVGNPGPGTRDIRIHETHEGRARPLRIGNVGSDGSICWGGSATRNLSSTPREAWNTFWAAPFNSDLVEGQYRPGMVPPDRREEFNRALEEQNARILRMPDAEVLGPTYVRPSWAPPRILRTEEHDRQNPDIRRARFRDKWPTLSAERKSRRLFRRVWEWAQYPPNGEQALMERIGTAEIYYRYSYRSTSQGRPDSAREERSTADTYATRALTLVPPRHKDWAAREIEIRKSEAFDHLTRQGLLDDAHMRLLGEFAAGSADRFYGGEWRRNCSAVPLSQGIGIDVPAQATHAILSTDAGLLRLIPPEYRARDTEDTRPSGKCPHRGCTLCATLGYYVLGFAFQTGPDTYLGMVCHPTGSLPPIRVMLTRGAWTKFGPRQPYRKTAAQERRTRRYIVRMRAFRDPVLRAALATVTLPGRMPVVARNATPSEPASANS